MFQHGLKNLLTQQEKIEIVGVTASPDQAIEQVKSLQPDVVILDSTNMPGDPLASLKRIFRACPDIKVICLSLYNNQVAIYQVIRRRATSSTGCSSGKLKTSPICSRPSVIASAPGSL
jgi:DNA-binding NarL/FixJ family response regulator